MYLASYPPATGAVPGRVITHIRCSPAADRTLIWPEPMLARSYVPEPSSVPAALLSSGSGVRMGQLAGDYGRRKRRAAPLREAVSIAVPATR